jgi:hypothetical protein
MENIQLNNIQGSSRLTGQDLNGLFWTQFEVDYFAEQLDGECDICQATISSGWLCLDGGEEVCSDHVTIEPTLYCEACGDERPESDLDGELRCPLCTTTIL